MVNKVILVGNVGANPDVKYLDNGTAKATFRLATNEVYTKDGDKNQHTEWHNIVLWGKRAEMAEKYIQKGKKIYIEGRLRTRSFDDKEGNKKYITEIRGDIVQFLDRKSEFSGSNEDNAQPSQTANTTDEPLSNNDNEADDLPF